MSERFVSGVSAKMQILFLSFPFTVSNQKQQQLADNNNNNSNDNRLQ